MPQKQCASQTPRPPFHAEPDSEASVWAEQAERSARLP
jgi:hypothetical protein